MRATFARVCIVTVMAGANAVVLAPVTAAHAGSPVGTCTKSYTAYTQVALVAVDPSAGAVFGAVDKNGDGTVCYKAYPNGPHQGHGGNLVDNTAAPHQ